MGRPRSGANHPSRHHEESLSVQPALGTTPASKPPMPAPCALFGRVNAAAIGALARAIELHDPGLARRAALRAALVIQAAEALSLDGDDPAAALAGALLADVGSLVTHVRPAADGDVAAAVLGANLLDRAGLGGPISSAVRHRCERWDGRGAPLALGRDAIPYPARVVAVADGLVGPVEADGVPHWLARAGRARSLASTVFDPGVVATLTTMLDAGAVPDPSMSIGQALAALGALAGEGGENSPAETLTSIGAAIHAADRIDDVLALIAGHVRRALGSANVGIGRFDPSARSLVVLAQAGDLAAASEPSAQIRLDSFPVSSAFRGDHAHAYSRREITGPGAELHHLDAHGAESELGVPLHVDGHRWGVLWARTARGGPELGERDLAIVRLAATQIEAGVAQATRLADLESLALRDPLTGLGNRRVLDTTLRRIFARPPIARQDCAVIICDVDGLKVINDTEGHAAGDAVLVDAAVALRHAVAGIGGATVCRIGGDEFCVVLDGGGLLHAEPVAVQAQRLFARSGPERSMSCGVAVAAIGINAPGELLRAADEAQYLQKRGRRGDATDLAGRGGRRARRDR